MAHSLLSRFSISYEKKLLALQKNDPNHKLVDKWSERAVKSLVKILKKESGALKELEKVITKQDPDTSCILIPKSSDCRLQVSHRKGLPHVVYCKLWRWPDLQSHHQIKSSSSCKHPFDSKISDLICINPYHYERIQAPPLPSVYVPRLAYGNSEIPPDLSTSHEDYERSTDDCDQPLRVGTVAQQPTITVEPMAPAATQIGYDNHVNAYRNTSTLPSLIDQVDLQPHTTTAGIPYNRHIPNLTNSSSDQILDSFMATSEMYVGESFQPVGGHYTQYEASLSQQQQQLQQPSQPFREFRPQLQHQPNNVQVYHSLPAVGGSSVGYSQEQPQSFYAPLNQQAPQQLDLNQVGFSDQSAHPHQTNMYDQQPCSSRHIIQETVHDNLHSQLQPSTSAPILYGGKEVKFIESKHWCSILYYELAQRVGEKFQAGAPSIIVDGLTDPSGHSRFCLGSLSNVNRKSVVSTIRGYIRRGVRLYYIGGKVYAENLSDSSIFVQSPDCNQRLKWHLATVCKIPPRCNLQIFNTTDFASLLSTTVNQGYEAVYQLTRMCTIRMSFVKGWGQDYKRTHILSTPCWIEIQLNGPLEWIDRVLRQMKTPDITCGSSS